MSKTLIVIASIAIVGTIGGYFIYRSQIAVTIDPSEQQNAQTGPQSPQRATPNAKRFEDRFRPTLPEHKN